MRLGGILATDPDPDAVYADVSHVIPHPDYNSVTIVNDIGLLRLTSPITYTDTILPICLPSSTVNLDQFKVCVDTGFGRTDYYGLLQPFFYFVRQTIFDTEHVGRLTSGSKCPIGKNNHQNNTLLRVSCACVRESNFGMWGRVADVINGVKFNLIGSGITHLQCVCRVVCVYNANVGHSSVSAAVGVGRIRRG